MRSTALALLLMVAAPACGGEIETAEDCVDAGHIVRPAPGPPAECEAGETQVAEIPFGIEGAVCCASN